MKRKGFTLVELLAVIVILAILMVSAGTGVMSVMNNSKVNTFKNEVLTAMNAAENIYSEISMTPAHYSYIKRSQDSNYGGLCVTLSGLVSNGYLEKDIKTYAGVFLVEIPYSGGQPKITAWVHNSTYGINGIEKSYINRLRFKKENNKSSLLHEGTTGSNTTENISGGILGIVTNLKGIKQMIKIGYGSEGALGIVTSNKSAGKTIVSYPERGGAGQKYGDGEGYMTCINAKL